MRATIPVLLLLLVACPSEPILFPEADTQLDAPGLLEVSGEALEGNLDCDPSRIRVARINPWPGGGLQLLVTSDQEGEIAVGGIDGSIWPAAVQSVPEARGVTGLALVLSDDAAVLATRVAEAKAFVEDLPAQEKIALWSVGKTVRLLADATKDKDHIAARLEAAQPEDGGLGTLWKLDLEAKIAQLSDPFGTVHRQLVLVGEMPIEATLSLVRPVQICGLIEGETVCRGSMSAAQGRENMIRIGACPPEIEGTLLLRVGESLCEVPLDLPELEPHLACDPGLAAIDHFPLGLDVQVELDAAQRSRFDRFDAERSQEEFVGLVTMGDRETLQADLHFRGAGSMKCSRKSLKVNLAGNDPQRLVHGGAGDEFYLISLCKDDRYFNQVFANRLLSEMGQFPLDGRYIRLRINSKSYGAYYLLEHAKEKLLTEHVALGALVRRRFDPHGKPEDIKFPDDEAGMLAAQEAYDALAQVALEAAPEGLMKDLEALMDVDRYLRWVAFSTFMRNGDTIDEAMFFASNEAGELFFRHMGWDADDLFSDCHHASEYALVDPHELIYCAEGNIDKALLRSPQLYERYVGHLEGLLLSELGPERLKETMLALRLELFEVLSDDETAQAMVEIKASNPEATTAQAVREDIWAHMEGMLEEAEARRSLLLERIDLYRAAP